MDSAYDRENIYEDILFDYNVQAIIPINKKTPNSHQLAIMITNEFL